MSITVAQSKAVLRRRMLAELVKLDEPQRARAATEVCALIRAQETWKRARKVLLYAPLSGEMDIWPLLEVGLAEGKVVALPKYFPEVQGYVAGAVREPARDVAIGHLRIREPRPHCELVPLNQLDFTLVPGIAFDLTGRRLGRGKGFYDRLLAAVGGLTCGVAFEQQLVSQVPVEPHDIHLNCIVTPTRWIEL